MAAVVGNRLVNALRIIESKYKLAIHAFNKVAGLMHRSHYEELCDYLEEPTANPTGIRRRCMEIVSKAWFRWCIMHTQNAAVHPTQSMPHTGLPITSIPHRLSQELLPMCTN